jgi:NADH-quinone oxidoreductase subunit N
MTWASLNAIAALPELFLLCAVSLILIIDLWLTDPTRKITYCLTLLTLLGCACLSVDTFFSPPQYAFNHMFVSDPMSGVLKIAMYLAVGLMLVYGRVYAIKRDLLRGELFTLALFALLGMMVMTSASNLLTLYVGLELLSLSLYALIALKRDSAQATEAAMKYFVLGALASGLLLYGMSMVYGATGSLDIAVIAESVTTRQANILFMVLGLVFIVTGIGFKLGVVPFHMWVPDVYQGAPTIVTQLIGSGPKLAAFAFMIRLLAQGFEAFVADWQAMLIVLAVLSLIIGNVAAIAQTNIKRMFAYSTISHMGFMLLGFLAGTQAGYAAAMFYVLTYVLMVCAAFGLIMLVSREGFEADNIDDFKGLGKRHPWFAWMMLCVMFSMAGIPVFVGFFAKLSVLKIVVSLGMNWLAIIAVIASLIGAFYYLRVVKVMFFDEAVEDRGPLVVGLETRILLSLNAGLLLLLGILPNGLMVSMQQAITFSLLQ